MKSGIRGTIKSPGKKIITHKPFNWFHTPQIHTSKHEIQAYYIDVDASKHRPYTQKFEELEVPSTEEYNVKERKSKEALILCQKPIVNIDNIPKELAQQMIRNNNREYETKLWFLE